MRLCSVVVLAFVASCAAAPSATVSPLGRVERPDALRWAPCSLQSGAANDASARCQETAAPLRRAEPSGRTIRLFVKWIPAKRPDHRSIWLVPGGPGYAGSRMESFAERLHDADPGLDVYLPDHRGTGRSMRLGCATEESDASPGGSEITEQEWPACFASLKTAWGDDGLAAFNTTEAANDIGAWIERTRAPFERQAHFRAVRRLC